MFRNGSHRFRPRLPSGSSNFQGGSRRDPREVRIVQMARRIGDAKETLDLQDRLRGRIGERYLRILGNRLSYADAAAFEGKAGPRGTAFIAESFRCALKDAVPAVQQARGMVSPAPDDKHAEAAASVADRLPSTADEPAPTNQQD